MTPAWVLAGVNWLATAAGLYLAGLAATHPNKIARELVGVAIMAAEWGFAAGMEILADDYAGRLLWSQIAYIGTYGSVAWLFRFWVRWLRPDSSRKWLWLLGVVPTIMVIAAFTNSRHLLLWPTITPSTGHPALWAYGHGPLFWFGATYEYLIILAGFILLLSELPKRQGIYRRQLLIMLSGVLVPIVANVVYLTGLVPATPLDPTPIALTISIVLYLIGINASGLLELVPAAKSRVLALMPDGVLVLDDASRIIDWNEAALQFCGASGQHMMGTPVDQVFTAWRSIGVLATAETGTHPVRRFITTVTPSENERYVLQVSVAPLPRHHSGRGATTVLLHDMTELADVQERLRSANQRLEELNTELHRQAIHDSLTGFYNRHYMDETLEHEVERARRYDQPLGLLVMDMDRFKEINDTHGHPVGDHALQTVAIAIKREVRSVDLLCRFGGDEFVVIMPGANQEQAGQIAERLRSRVRELEITHSEQTIRLTLSIGYAVFPDDGSTVRELFLAADNALLEAKDGGRDQTASASSSPTP